MTITRFVCFSDPIGKPRMTRRDTWKKRPCVVRYRQWCDALREAAGVSGKMRLESPCRLWVVAYFPLPASWKRRKVDVVPFRVHTSKPDWDNVAKGIMDALISNDEYVCKGHIEKYWDDGKGARVEVYLEEC